MELAAGLGFLAVLIFLVVGAILAVPFWFIMKRAGFSPFLALIVLIPIPLLPLLGVMGILAFGRWPAGESGRRSTLQDLMRQVQGGR